jgi:hypothetical protein
VKLNLSPAVGVMMKEMIMTIRELKLSLDQALEYHDLDELICIYDQETGERYDILIVDDTIDGEIQLNIEVK